MTTAEVCLTARVVEQGEEEICSPLRALQLVMAAARSHCISRVSARADLQIRY